MRRLLFLDVDGVLNTAGYLMQPDRLEPDRVLYDAHLYEDMIDPKAVAILNRIVEATGAEIVISSSWRHAKPYPEMGEILKRRGFTGRVIGDTPTSMDGVARGHEIDAWLNEHADPDGPDVCFVILDDMPDMVHLTPRLVLTNFADGLTDAHADRAIAMLRGAP